MVSSKMREQRVTIANAMQIVRPKHGDMAGVGLYRMLRLVALEDIIGPGAGAITYYAGKKLGQSLDLDDLDDFLEICKQLNIGDIDIPLFTDEKVHVDIYECVTCAGLDPVGRVLCHFEGGLIAGALQSILGKKVQAREVTCIGGLGDETCGYDIGIGKSVIQPFSKI
jgi:predicted hydrocarbon binding protein